MIALDDYIKQNYRTTGLESTIKRYINYQNGKEKPPDSKIFYSILIIYENKEYIQKRSETIFLLLKFIIDIYRKQSKEKTIRAKNST